MYALRRLTLGIEGAQFKDRIIEISDPRVTLASSIWQIFGGSKMEPPFKISFVQVGIKMGCCDVVFHSTSGDNHYVAVSLFALAPNPGDGWKILTQQEVINRLLEWGFEIHDEQVGPIPDGTVNSDQPIAMESDEGRQKLIKLLKTEFDKPSGHDSRG